LLSGRVVVVTGDVAGAARAVVEEGGHVVIVGADAAALGALARDLESRGAHPAVVVGELADPAVRATLAALIAELHPT
jgi:NADP-dependent 3-hydroxy acid dehydrogenase YdfG